VKKLAKLALFFSISFAVLFIATTGFRFLALRVDWIRTLPQRPETILITIIAAAHWALTVALHGSLLISLSYIVRNRFFMMPSLGCLFVLAMFFNFGISVALKNWEFVPPSNNMVKPLGGPGIILTNSLKRGETAVILLKGPGEPRGSRVTAIPGQPLSFHEQAPAHAEFTLPPVPFGNENPWFLKSLAIDIRLSGTQIQQRFDQGIFPFLIYSGALILLLCSLSFILNLSAWPLANIFLGFLAFRGVLALETFFNSPDMQDVFDSFLVRISWIQVDMAVPLIFCLIAVLIYVYSILVFIAKRRSQDED